MKTSKAFATISYNTDDFLVTKLDDLIRRHKIDFYAYIEHQPEEDEKKAHKHLLIIPNGQFDTNALIDYLSEIPKEIVVSEDGTCKPLTCINAFKVNSFGDWYYYTIHDKKYLANKGQSRKIEYCTGDFVVSDIDYFQELIRNIDLTKLFRTQRFFDALAQGSTILEMVKQGIVPIQQVNQYISLYSMYNNDNLNRNGRTTHTPLDQEAKPVSDNELDNSPLIASAANIIEDKN